MNNTLSWRLSPLLPALALAMIASLPASGAAQIALEWQRTLGGSSFDILSTAQPAPDGGYLLGGSSSSAPGPQKSSPFYGGSSFEGDFWIVRLDAAGNKVWDRSFGGGTNEALYSLLVTSDGGFLGVGSSSSPTGGNKTSPNYGLRDFFVVRGDAGGTKLRTGFAKVSVDPETGQLCGVESVGPAAGIIAAYQAFLMREGIGVLSSRSSWKCTP